MLLEMRLRGLGVIRDAVLELGPGLTVVTGETGAGKTMVVTGLGLLMGRRSDTGAVRSGVDGAVVEGRIAVDPDGPVAARALQAGAVLDDDVLVLSRSVPAQGRGRAYLGGRMVPVGLLAELSDDLLTVHGQSDQQRLRSTARQRQALDRFAGPSALEPLARYRRDWARRRTVLAELAEITQRSRERAQEAELLRLGIAEIERIDPRPAEDVELRAEAERLAHAEELRAAADLAHLALAGRSEEGPEEPAAGGLVGLALQALEQAASHDETLAGLASRVGEIGYLLSDVAADCASYAAGVDVDPLRLAAVEERRADLISLTRAYGPTIEQVVEWAQRSSRRLLELEGDCDRGEQLEQELQDLTARLAQDAARLCLARSSAADRMAGAVTAELRQLAMPDARLEVRVSRRPDPEGLVIDLGDGPVAVAVGPEGADDVELLLSPHPGAEPRPVAKGASGGELSRVMLGLEVVLGAADPVPTFVFDEVDAGVGGSAALGIGRRLAMLARTSQVLVVTHLPQVAAFADRHLRVRKASDGQVTESGVTCLDAEGRVRELSRMLAGLEDSGTARAHAEELLRAARESR
ncbi:MAG: repair protein RecN [Actinomycetota bacterium]|nr:repair protein RecN [Actinomycetota bacterium]